MKTILLIILALYVFIAFVTMVIFMFSGVSSRAWGHRIKKVTYKNGTIEFFIQQRLPLSFLWVNCQEHYGYDSYRAITFKKEDRAKEFIQNFKESVEENKGWRVDKSENIEI